MFRISNIALKSSLAKRFLMPPNFPLYDDSNGGPIIVKIKPSKFNNKIKVCVSYDVIDQKIENTGPTTKFIQLDFDTSTLSALPTAASWYEHNDRNSELCKKVVFDRPNASIFDIDTVLKALEEISIQLEKDGNANAAMELIMLGATIRTFANAGLDALDIGRHTVIGLI